MNELQNICKFADQNTLSRLIHTNKKLRKYIFDNKLIKKDYKYKVEDYSNIDFGKQINPYSYYIKYKWSVEKFAKIINNRYVKKNNLNWLTLLVDWIIISNNNERRLLQNYLHKDLKNIVDRYFGYQIIKRFYKKFEEVAKFHTLLE